MRIARGIQLGAAVLSCSLAGTASAAILGPTPYTQFADSPFSGPGYTMLLVDFENGQNPSNAGLSVSNGVVAFPDALVDSVDGDDGFLDGSGQGGHSWYLQQTSTSFVFHLAGLGALPTHVGIVWTDVGNESALDHPFGVGEVTFEAFDGADVSLGSVTAILGDGAISGATAEDRFFGAFSAGGIGRITISMPQSNDWEIDHLQYGAAAVPVPAAAWLFGSAICGLLGLRRRRVG